MIFSQYNVPERTWKTLSTDVYALHQAVMVLFAEYTSPGRVLFRAEPSSSGGIVLVQSMVEPRAGGLTMGLEPMGLPKSVDLSSAFKAGDRLKFRLVAAPMKRPILPPEAPPEDAEKPRNRIPLNQHAEQLAWLTRKAEKHGFSLVSQAPQQEWIGFSDVECPSVTITKMGDMKGKKNDNLITVRPVRFDGLLQVTDPELFYRAIVSGIGPAKGFGMGLLSLKK